MSNHDTPEECANQIIDELSLSLENTNLFLEKSRWLDNTIDYYNAGQSLMSLSRKKLTMLKDMIGNSSEQFMRISDRLAKTIMLCSVHYYNKSEDENASNGAFELLRYASSIATNENTKDKCIVNMNILKRNTLSDRNLY